MATRTATETPAAAEAVQFPDISEIRRAIPAHCFQPSVARSMGYVARDLTLAAGLVALALQIPSIENTVLRWTAWIAYGYAQGLVGTGIWILGHECGHGAFSLHRRFNDFMGWFLHSLLCVPFFSWKFSHARHHQFTGHMEKDMAFVPRTKEDFVKSWSNLQGHDHDDEGAFTDTPIVTLVRLVFHQLFGWPAYLLFNVSAGKKSLQERKGNAMLPLSHFDPSSLVFRPKEAPYILISDIGLALVLFGLYQASQVLSFKTVFLLYGVPWFWVHHWLVAITYLHHTHPEVPHYDEKTWTFVKGALSTVDRDFGFVGRHLFHGIIETHVVHHLFSRIPFYYADEATEAIKPVLGPLYRRETRSFVGQLWSTFRRCKWVENSQGVLHWQPEKKEL